MKTTFKDSTKDLKEQWIKYVKTWNKEKFGKAECLGCNRKESLQELSDFITRSINDNLVDSKDSLSGFPLSKSYSSKGMSEFQQLIFLISESQKALFDDGCEMMTSIVFDTYNIKYGVKELLDILAKFVKWNDIA